MVFLNLLPIFGVIAIGWAGHRTGIISDEFALAGNRVVFYVSFPAFLFRALSEANFHEIFSPPLLLSLILALTGVWIITLLLAHLLLNLRGATKASFLQCSIHSNIGYVGMAVIFYFLGKEGTSLAASVIGFLIMAQNFLAVLSLSLFSEDQHRDARSLLKAIALNPLILTCLLGLISSYFRVTLPLVAQRCIGILGGMALPAALLIVGANLSFRNIQGATKPLVFSIVLKLGLLPLGGLIFMEALAPGAPLLQRAVIVALLGAPTATAATIMAGEMGGDVVFASAAVTGSLIGSVISYTLWFSLTIRLA